MMRQSPSGKRMGGVNDIDDGGELAMCVSNTANKEVLLLCRKS